VLLSFYHYLQDNPCLQDNDSYPLSNLILNQIQTSKKRMSLIETLFLTREETLAQNSMSDPTLFFFFETGLHK
jgi:hypothetical protein